MSAPGLSFPFGAGAVNLTAAGLVDSVGIGEVTATTYLRGGGEVRARQHGAAVSWVPGELVVDADEVEASWTAAGGLRATVRHSFGSAWRVRLAIRNAGLGPAALDDLELGWSPAPDRPAWALAAGAVAAVAVLPGSADRPVLGGTLESGACRAVTDTGLRTGPIVVAPGGRFVVQWHWDWYAHACDLVQRRPAQHGFRHLPRHLVWPTGASAVVRTGPDEALLVGPGVAIEPVAGGQELIGSPGPHGVEVRWHRGVTAYELAWAEPTLNLLVDQAEAVLRGPTTRAGVVRLDTPSAALVVQLALSLGRASDTDAAEEAVERYVSLLEPVDGSDPELDPLDALLLQAEVDRTGQSDLLALATRAVVAPMPAPDLTELVDWLGAGLAGHPVRPGPAEDDAYRLAMLSTIDERGIRALEARLADSLPGLLASREAALVTRLAGQPLGPAHGWLAIVARSH